MNSFLVLRSGTNSTFQDEGFHNLQHLGITSAGVMDKKLFLFANYILDNKIDTPVIEFSLQGPILKLAKGSCRFAITGNVLFKIIKKNKAINGVCNRSYILNEGETLDIISTINSNYGYFSVEGGFFLKKEFGCYSTLIQSKIGTNNGKPLSQNQKIYFKKNGSKINYILDEDNENKKINIIRVIRGPQMNYFMLKEIKKFFNNNFIVSKNSNKTGIRLKGNKIKATVSSNIISEGIAKGSIQIPGNGDPIVLMTDHPTIGGYPKIAVVILSDLHKIAQLPIGSKFKFKEISLDGAEKVYKKNIFKRKNKLKKI
tara:strand:+ start:224 stop:1165 length:942 start_codon:yes stop_codon:yes gene_type:complete